MLHANQHPPRQKTAVDRVHPLFHVFRSRQPDLSALSGGTGRHPPLAGLCRVCRQRHRPAHCRRGGRSPGRGAAPAGRAGAPPVCAGLLHSGISLHWAMPRHPPHGQHLVCDAGAAGRGKHRAAVGLLPPVFCSGLSGGPAPGEADPAAGQNPLPRLAGPDPAAVCGLSAPPGSSRLRHPDRRLHRPTRPWTLWPG